MDEEMKTDDFEAIEAQARHDGEVKRAKTLLQSLQRELTDISRRLDQAKDKEEKKALRHQKASKEDEVDDAEDVLEKLNQAAHTPAAANNAFPAPKPVFAPPPPQQRPPMSITPSP